MHVGRCWALRAFILVSCTSLLACTDAKTQVDFLKSLSSDSLFPGVVLKINGATSALGNNATPLLEVSGFSDSVKVELFTSSTCDASQKMGEITVLDSDISVNLPSSSLSSEGVYEYYAKVTSSLGLVSDCSKNKATYTYDITPPAAPSISLLTATHNEDSPVFQVSGLELDSTVQIYIDPTCSVSQGSTQATATSMSVTSAAISEGIYKYYAQAKDPAGNASACTSTYAQYIYDITPPAVPTAVNLSGVSNPDSNVNPSVEVDGVTTDDVVKVYSDSLCLTEVASIPVTSTSSAQTVMITPALTMSGTYGFYAKAVDTYGNASNCSTSFASYTLDITPPSVPTSLTLTTPATSPSNNSSPIITVNNVTVGDTITLYSDATCTTSVTSGVAGGVNIALGVPTLSTAGTYDFYARATDSLGNASACSTSKVSYIFDNVPPSAPSSIALSTPASSPSNVAQPSFTIGGMNNGELAKLFSDASCTTLVGSNTASGSSATVTLSSALTTSGVYTYYAKAYDAAGNGSGCFGSVSYTFDNVAPAAPSGLSLGTPSTSPSNVTTPSITISGVTVGDSIGLYSDSGCTVLKGQLTAGGSSIGITSFTLAEGSYNFYAKATDPAGNASSCSTATVSYVVDVTPPAAPSSLALGTPVTSPGNYVNPPIVVSTVATGDTVKVYTNAACTTLTGTSAVASGGSATVTTSSLGTVGSYNYYATATDPAGNTSACSSATVNYVFDNVAPTVTNVTSSNVNRKYGPGASISIQVTMSEAVTVSGTPTLMLNTTPTQYASYTSGSGTNTLTFAYTVAPLDSQADLNYYSTSSLALNGGFIRDLANNNATLTLPGIGAAGALGVNKDITIMPNPPKIALEGTPTIRINENDPAQTLQVDLEYESHYPITVHIANYSTMIAGSDYILSSNNVVVPAGSLSQTFTLSITNDAVSNGPRRLRLAIDSVNGAFPALLSKISQKEIYIRDDEAPGPAAQILGQGFGSNHTCIITTTGSPYCWGANANGLLGDGTSTNHFNITQASGLFSGYTQITTSLTHTCALNSNATNNLKCWGSNTNGQFGSPSPTASLTPFGLSLTYKKISAGQNYTCGIAPDDTLYCWGLNSSNQLGDGTSNIRTSPVLIDSGVPYLTVAAGATSTCGITSSGDLKCWGNNSVGQVGDGTSGNQKAAPVLIDSGIAYTKVGIGTNHACGLTQGGAVKCWGANTYGQLGDGTGLPKLIPTVAIASGAVDLAVGTLHTCAILSGGELRCWGYNFYGQVGDGSVSNRNAPALVANGVASVMAGNNHTCAIAASSGETKCWGDNNYSQLGSYDNYVKTLTLVDSNFATVATGKYHSCGLTTAGAVRCWGENTNGEVGDGTLSARTSPVQVIDSGVAQIAVGESFSCAVFSSGKLQCWGSNAEGRLGDNNTSSRRLRPYDIIASGVLQVSLGNNNACARLDNGSIQCWGYNGPTGKVGNNSTLQQNSPIEILDASFGISAISVSATHACALRSTGALYCWGDNSNGQYGNSSSAGFPTPTDTGLSFNQISVGYSYTCGITSTTLKCWGLNSSKQLGDGTVSPSSAPVTIDSGTAYAQVATGQVHTCGVTTAGTLKCWGSNGNYQLGSLAGTSPGVMVSSGVSSVATGDYTTCFRLSTSDVKCLGANASAALGDGNLTTLHLPTHVFGL